MVALHKEQFGRGPTLLCVMDDALLPAERTMVEMVEQQSVRDCHVFLQVATAEEFIATVEATVGPPAEAWMARQP
jgi:hypothetical protein